MRREPGPEQERGEQRLLPAVPVTQRPDAEHERAHRHHPADVLGRVDVEVAVQLVVQHRQREERQERSEAAQAELAAKRPQAGG